jgi:arginase
VAGLANHFRALGQAVGLIWIDAHSDINTPETSTTGNVHGMPLAALLGMGPVELSNLLGWRPKVLPQHTVLVGIRDVDEAERENIRRAGITAYTMRDIDELGLRAVMEKAIDAAANGTAGYHVSMDMDWVDPEEAPGVGTPVPGGATYREAHLAMEILADHGGMLSLELVEVNPILDERNRTAELAVQLICSAFGKKIF